MAEVLKAYAAFILGFGIIIGLFSFWFLWFFLRDKILWSKKKQILPFTDSQKKMDPLNYSQDPTYDNAIIPGFYGWF